MGHDIRWHLHISTLDSDAKEFDRLLANAPGVFAERREWVVGIRRVFEERSQKFQIGLEQLEALLQNNLDAIAKFAMRGHRLDRYLMAVLLHLLVEGKHDRLLR